MCLAIPGEIVDTEEIGGMRVGKVQFGSITRQTFLGFVPEAQPGDYVLVHVGFAISQVDEAEAAQTLRDLDELGLVGQISDLPQERHRLKPVLPAGHA
jgi:hydrogenase expression/formation protein HypC